MKASVFALLVSASSAVSLNDAPHYWPGPTWTQNHPSAAGFLQTSSCVSSGQLGVTCGPSDIELFATGMNGDEDLAQDITMKGDKFHYQQEESLAQWTPVVVKQDLAKNPDCNGVNGPQGVNCKVPAWTGTNGPLDGPVGAPSTREEPAAVPHYNTDAVAGRPYQTSGDLTPSDPAPPVPAQIVLQLSEEPAGDKKASKPVGEPEKVSIVDPKIAKSHTSFYGQAN